jgi:uncharacterized protein DUF2561
MTYNTKAAARSRFDPMANDAENLDRILVSACVVIWLAVLGSAVAATVALVDLGSAHAQSESTNGTPWLLYGVIGVSALVIVGAIPLLVRARRAALDDPRAGRPAPRPPAGRPQAAVRAAEPRTQKIPTREPIRRPGGHTAPSKVSTFDASLPPVVDRLWLRCALIIACAMGVALLAIGIATYLLAVDTALAAWILLGLAGVVTLAMPAIPLYFLRQLRAVVD